MRRTSRDADSGATTDSRNDDVVRTPGSRNSEDSLCPGESHPSNIGKNRLGSSPRIASFSPRNSGASASQRSERSAYERQHHLQKRSPTCYFDVDGSVRSRFRGLPRSERSIATTLQPSALSGSWQPTPQSVAAHAPKDETRSAGRLSAPPERTERTFVGFARCSVSAHCSPPHITSPFAGLHDLARTLSRRREG